MSKAKQKKKISQLKRKQMVEEVFKKGKKQREVAKKFDEKIAQRQGSLKKKEKYQMMKREVSGRLVYGHFIIMCFNDSNLSMGFVH